MNEQNGAHLLGQKPRMSVPLAAFVRELDDTGTYQADGVRMLPDGNGQAIIRREQYLDAQELLDAVQCIVQAELETIRAILGTDELLTTIRMIVREELAAVIDRGD